MAAYYNENDEFMVAWLRELMNRGVIAPGVVDGRSIKEVRVEDLKGFTQCHFFAGCGVWSYALRQAGWQDDWPCWTGSCPCQPFSVSGKRQGASDGRHLYPVWGKLIEVAQPVVIFGEQVASDDGLAWIDFVQAHLERQAYTVGTVDLCSAGFGAPHARQRLYFVADSGSESGRTEHEHESGRRGASQPGNAAKPRRGGRTGSLGQSERLRCDERQPGNGRGQAGKRGATGKVSTGSGGAGQLGISECAGLERHSGDGGNGNESGRLGTVAGGSVTATGASSDLGDTPGRGRGMRGSTPGDSGRASFAGFTNGFWRDAEWLWCRDEKYRPVEPGTFPLAAKSPCRVGRLRGYGNALTAEVAKEFIKAYLEVSS